MTNASKKILIIEEDVIVSRIFQSHIVKELGAEVFTAIGIEEGIRKLEEEKIDLLVIDIFLNNQPTLGSIAKIKKNSRTSLIPIVLITVISDKEHVLAAQALGIRYFITKGNDSLHEAMETIKKAIGD